MSPANRNRFLLCLLVAALFLVTVVTFRDFASAGIRDFRATAKATTAGLLVLVLGITWLLGSLPDGRNRTRMILAFCSYLGVTILAFYPAVSSVFRSDYWLIATLFNGIDGISLEGIRRVAFFEMFGDPRFQPLAHLLMYARHLLFGNTVALYNILTLLCHACTGFMVFFLALRFTDEVRLSFLVGAIFIVLPSQFDIVLWSYHLYIIVGTLFVLLAIALIREYSLTGRRSCLWLSCASSLLSVLLYEPALLVPVFLFLLTADSLRKQGAERARSRLAPVAVGLACVYAFYACVMLYGLAGLHVPGSGRFGSGHLFSWNTLEQGIGVTVANVWESTFLKNTGLMPDIRITDLVYVLLPDNLFSRFTQLFKVLCGVLLVLQFRSAQRTRVLVSLLCGTALSYLLIICIGRVLTNDLQYIVSQPRYQYFSNALFLVVAAALLLVRYRSKAARPFLACLLVAVFAWNSQAVLLGTKKVTQALRPLNRYHARVEEFLTGQPSALIFLDFVPHMNGKLALGADVALDVLFKGHITKSVTKATHIYDGETFRKNEAESSLAVPVRQDDFTVEWMRVRPPHLTPRKEVFVVGSAQLLPAISLMPEGFVRVSMLDRKTGRKVEYRFPDPYHRSPGKWASMVVEKSGDQLCFAYDGTLEQKIALDSEYRSWDRDGLDLVGDYYRGIGEVVYIGNLFIRAGAAKHQCDRRFPGDRLSVDLKTPW